jgi:hypothetical protein
MAQSFYNALNVELKKRFSHGFQFQVSYSWSKNIDDGTTGVALTDYGEGAISQEYETKADRGLSALNLAHKLVINGIYDLPSTARSGFSAALLGGWQIASIFSANTGTAFSVTDAGLNAPTLARSTGGQHPDMAPGRSSSGIVLGGPNQYFDPTAFILPPPGFFGVVGRNTLTGPGLVNWDFSLKKSTKLRLNEASRLEIHADFFNLFNRANFGLPSGSVLNATNGQPVATAGQISRTITPARQLQFGLKLIF